MSGWEPRSKPSKMIICVLSLSNDASTGSVRMIN
jgi:hypothetical protein